jgi:hypothetical protein
MEDRLKRRKLDALKRGVHRIGGDKSVPMATHVIGIGKSGAEAIAEILRTREAGSPRTTALAIDIGDQDLGPLRKLAEDISADQAEVTIVSLDVPRLDDLLATLGQYGEFLRLEYPQYRWREQPSWLDISTPLPAGGSHFPRAVAKAIYGHAQYRAPRLPERALRAFAAGVDAERSQAAVAIIFGLGGGTGSGIAVDLARHLSNRLFGRRVLVAGIGIAPCAGDAPEHSGGSLFPVFNELDVLNDETKNRGVTISCGELFRNPFTAGFILVPQQHIFAKTGDLEATHRWIDREIATLISGRGGANLWELLRLLNWVAAPSTQHSAARTPWGARWIHMLGSVDATEPAAKVAEDLPNRLGLRQEYHPEFIEIRAPAADDAAAELAAAVEAAFRPDVPPQVVDGNRDGAAQFILPRIGKHDLALFHAARAAYQGQSPDQRRLGHALLLEQGVLLCEPSTKLAGMAGASLSGGEAWIAVPLAEVWGEALPDRIVEVSSEQQVCA